MAFDYTLITAFINGTNRGEHKRIQESIRRRHDKRWEQEWERRRAECLNSSKQN